MLGGMRALAALLSVLTLVGCGGDDGGGGSGGSSGAAGSGGGGGAAVSCASYCDTLMTSCTGGDQQYLEKGTCLASCSAFPLGNSGEKTGNSLECRAYHAGNVAKAGVEHCSHAGPAGDAVCGENCEGYCALMAKHCPNAYASPTECASQCAGITGATASGYDIATKSGDSLFCRIYHATAASTDPTTHCDHAKLDPTAACL